jgi:hypothetical protein
MNDDDLSIQLKEAVRAEPAAAPPNQDILGAKKKGKRLLWRKWASAALAVLVLAGGGWAVGNELTSERTTAPVGPEDRGESVQADPPEIDEPTERAVVHAIRALVQADLFDPQGDRYSYRRGEATEEGWTVTFNRLLCGRFGDVETCRPVHESGPDSPIAKARLEIVEQDGSLVVEGASGSFDEGKREEVVGFSLPITDEPPHWEWSVGVGDRWDDEKGSVIKAAEYWVGPIPTEMPGSRCVLTGYDSDGQIMFVDVPYWHEAPRHGEAGRSSGLFGREINQSPDSATYECEPFDGVGWQPIGDPRLIRDRRSLWLKTRMVWRDEGMVWGKSFCSATVFDASGRRIFRAGSPIDRFGGARDVRLGPPFRFVWRELVLIRNRERAKSATVTCRFG